MGAGTALAARFVTCLALASIALPTSLSTADDGGGVEYVNGALFLDQGWSRENREEFYYTSQGSQLMPYAWLLHLDRAGSSERFLDPDDGLGRYGYLADPLGLPERNPDGLPIGFVMDPPRWTEPDCEFVGLTCAACHTRLFEHKDKQVHIDGGPTTADMHEFLVDLRDAMTSTAADSSRLAAFEARLPEKDRGGTACMPDLKQSLEAHSTHLSTLLDPPGQPADAAAWGPARLDAVGIIVNQLFLHLDLPENLAKVDAPVSYPFLWDTHQHNQVQWNGVSRFPIVRNITEVLGVFADYGAVPGTKLDSDGLPKELLSTVRSRGLTHLEDHMAPLRSPLWPVDLFQDPIDEASRARGKVLFEAQCERCHADVPRDEGIPSIQAEMTNLLDVGTDPGMANNFSNRPVRGTKIENAETGVDCLQPAEKPGFWSRLAGYLVPGVPHPSPYRTPPVEGVLQNVVPKIFDGHATLTSVKEFFRAAVMPNTTANRCAYKGRPLDGIWATAPYLHNGSVPTLDELLKHPDDRVDRFCVLKRQAFDPVKVGLVVTTSCAEPLDTTKPGNRNTGHHYPFIVSQDPPVTRPYTAQERADLVMYQKSL